MNFQQLTTTKKGNIGEAIARGILERAGWNVYDCKQNQPHVVDFLCHKAGRLIGVDVKTYPRRRHHPDTGIDVMDFAKYLSLGYAHRMPVYLVWIDEIEQAAYSGRLRTIERHAYQAGGKIYFPLSALRLIRHLWPDELAALQAVSTVDAGKYAGVEYFFPWMRVNERAGKPPGRV